MDTVREAIRVRGSNVLSTVAFAERLCAQEGRPPFRDGLSPETTAALAATTPTSWCPREAWMEMLRGLVALRADEAGARDVVVRCGRAICEDATNAFLKLLIKFMTPSLFCKKFPDFWRRDFQGGELTVDASEISRNRFTTFIRGIGGFDHVGPIGVGFVGFAMDRVAKKEVQVELVGWSLACPGPPEVRLVVSW